MNLLTVSISHNTAPAECFERFACSDCDKEDLLHKVKLLKNISESFVIATCNRLDVTVVYSSNVSSIFELGTSIINEICLYKGLTTTDYIHFFKRYSGEDAVTQIFRVTCGLDSALLGETEIAGQIKMAYKYCCREKSCGFLLNKLFHSAFRTAKAVKSKTEFNSGAVSVAYAAVKWIRNETAEIRIPKILIIGAGKMAELAIKHLLENEINNITVLNRTDARAESLSALYKIDYKPWHNLSEAINNCDAVIAAVSSPSPIFNGDIFSGLPSRLVIADISMPGCIEKKSYDTLNISIANIEKLKNITDSNFQKRLNSIPDAESIISMAKGEFVLWYKTLEVTPAIIRLNEMTEKLRIDHINTYKAKWSAEQISAIEEFSQSLVKKIISSPLKKLRESVNHGSASSAKMVSEVEYLFNLNAKESSR